MYGYGYRYNSGLVVGAGGGAPFVNTYSTLLDGVDDYVKTGTQSLGITTAISISAWVKIPIAGTWGAPHVEVIFAEDGFSRNFNLFYRPPPFFNYFNFTVYHTNGTSTALTSTGIAPNDNQWHNLLATFDGTTNTNSVKLYVDGILNVQATAVSTGVKSALNAPPAIGSNSNNNTWFFEGNIDEVAVWDSAISIGDVWDVTSKPTDLSLLTTPPLHWWKMGDGITAFPTIPDVGSLASNDGTAYNENEATMIVPDVP
jgi:hypothetical protein